MTEDDDGTHNGADLIQGGERRRFAMPIPLRGDFDAPRLRGLAKEYEGCAAGAAASGAGRDLRRGDADRGGEDWRGDVCRSFGTG